MQGPQLSSSEQAGAPERFDPDSMAGGLMEAEHRARYWWAGPAVAGRDVLDAGCGNGYGLELLAEAGPTRLVGVDVSDQAVVRAGAALGDAAEVVQADLHYLPFEDASFDIVVCFEVIEHITDQNQALAELKRVLRSQGALLISSPNRGVYPPGNPHHVREYRRDEFESALRDHFERVELHQQHPWLTTAITPDGVPAGAELTTMLGGRVGSGLAPGDETYVVATATDSAVAGPQPLMVMGDDFEARWWHEQVDTLRAERNTVAREREELAISAAQARDEVGRLGARLLDLEQVAARAQDLEWRLGQMTAERKYLADVIEDMKASISWRITAPLRRARRRAS